MDLLRDFAGFEGTDLALEPDLAREFWATTPLAGLQFYDYGCRDAVLGTEVMPAHGDRLALMRRADNPFDTNATEVWWRNEYQIGHLPRSVAAEVAPLLDAGKVLRAYVVDVGNGEAWSVKALLVGAAAEAIHKARLDRVAARVACELWPTELEIRDYQRVGYIRSHYHWIIRTAPAPTERQKAAVANREKRLELARVRRHADLVFAFASLPTNVSVLPPEALVLADERLRGTTFGWWDQVPAWLLTRSQLRRHGLKPGKGAQPFAAVEYGRGRRHRRYDVYAVSEAPAMKVTAPDVRAQLAEESFWLAYERQRRDVEWEDNDSDIPF